MLGIILDIFQLLALAVIAWGVIRISTEIRDLEGRVTYVSSDVLESELRDLSGTTNDMEYPEDQIEIKDG